MERQADLLFRVGFRIDDDHDEMFGRVPLRDLVETLDTALRLDAVEPGAEQ